MVEMDKLYRFVGCRITSEQAEALGRAVFAGAVLNDGHVALVLIIDHKRAVGVTSAYGDNDGIFKQILDEPVMTPAEYEKAMNAHEAKS